MIIRGYCAPFDQVTPISSGHEVLRQQCFAEMLRQKLPVTLQHASHDSTEATLASTEDQSLELFEDGYGLAFEARFDGLNSAHRGCVFDIVQNGFGCSVNFTSRVKSVAKFNGYVAENVSSAIINHVAIVRSPAYRNAVAWRGDVALGLAPIPIRDAAARWKDGFSAARTQAVPHQRRASVGMAAGAAARDRAYAAFMASEKKFQMLNPKRAALMAALTSQRRA